MIDKGKFVAPTSVATWFINRTDREAGDTITHLKLQKLIYYAEAWFLANFDRSLIGEELQAWAHGPVSPLVYQRYRDRGWESLDRERRRTATDRVEPFLEAVYKEYGQFSAKRLEQMTHEEEPWRVTRGNLSPEAKCTTPIDKLLIRNYYAARLGKEKIQQLSD